jgi:hypothetical protein
MRSFLLTAMAAAIAVPLLLAGGAQAATMKQCSTNWSAMSATQKKATTHKAFMAGCLKGPRAEPHNAMMMRKVPKSHAMARSVKADKTAAARTASHKAVAAHKAASHSAMTRKASAHASAIPTLGHSGKAKCKDGTISSSKTHSGACSHHGGVAAWL